MIDKILSEWPQWSLCATPPARSQLKPLPGGLTNQCFLLTLGSGQYVLRIEGQNSGALDINRASEWLVHRLVAGKGLTPSVRYRSAPDRADGLQYWIRDYVPGHSLRSDELTLNRLMQMAAQLSLLHDINPPDDVPLLSVSNKASHYWNIISANTRNDELLALRAPLQSVLGGMPDNRRCLCHMDPLPANWILTPDDDLVLLDWEYAAIGHPLWDIAALLQNAGLNEEDESKVLYAYGIRDDRAWALAREQMNYLSALWYGAQGIWSERELEVYLTGLLALSN